MRFGFGRRKRNAQKVVANTAVLAPYGRPTFAQRHRRLMMFVLGVAAMFYGAAFAVTTTFFLVQLLIPLVPFLLFIVWGLPDRELGDSRITEWLLFGFVAVLLLWPNYLALTIPGMPWITFQRLLIFPLAIVFMVRLSQSARERRELAETLSAAPAIWKLVVAYAVLVVLSVGFSSTPFSTLNRAVVALIYWVMIFFVAAQVFARPGAITRFAYLLWFCVIVVCLIVIPEARVSHILWAGHIPSFLAVNDDAVQHILAGASRSATGMYRAQSTFSTPLGLAEFLGYSTPFLIHLLFMDPRLKVKAGIAATLPLVVYALFKTDSRLGFATLFSSVLLYALFYGAYRWVSDRRSVLGPAAVLSFPIGGLVGFAGTFLIGRVRARIWGNRGYSSSNEARIEQLHDAIPKIMSHPWGYGTGRGATELGFVNGDGLLTIDSYYLSTVLDIGLIGFVLFFSIFVVATLRAAIRSYRAEGELTFLAPAAMMMVNFVIIKSVLSQTDNHPLVFAGLGMIVALIYRFDRSDAGRDRSLAR